MSNDSATGALGHCRVCENGELVFAVLSSESRLVVECLECLTGYVEPSELLTSRLVRMEETPSRFATALEIECAGMTHLIAD